MQWSAVRQADHQGSLAAPPARFASSCFDSPTFDVSPSLDSQMVSKSGDTRSNTFVISRPILDLGNGSRINKIQRRYIKKSPKKPKKTGQNTDPKEGRTVETIVHPLMVDCGASRPSRGTGGSPARF